MTGRGRGYCIMPAAKLNSRSYPATAGMSRPGTASVVNRPRLRGRWPLGSRLRLPRTRRRI
ncbi:MAG: hypothetical protein PHN32_05665 [Actinomycetota bacterium]|nr:hypothetical protein [Actinomycetota bacterium]